MLPGLEDWAFFAVLDGHAGKLAADVSAETMLGESLLPLHLSLLAEEANYRSVCNPRLDAACAGSIMYEVLPAREIPEEVCKALIRGFLRHDHTLETNFGPPGRALLLFTAGASFAAH